VPGLNLFLPGQLRTVPGFNLFLRGQLRTVPGLNLFLRGQLRTVPGLNLFLRGQLKYTDSARIQLIFARTVASPENELGFLRVGIKGFPTYSTVVLKLFCLTVLESGAPLSSE